MTKHPSPPDVVGPSLLAAVALLLTLGLRLGVAPRFAAMFSDLGGDLPWLTRQFVSGWLGVAMAVVGGAVTILLARRSLLGGLVAGGLLVLLCLAAFLVAAYLPIFSIAGQIR